MAAYSLTDWIGTLTWSSDMKLLSSGEVEVNNIFFEEFFNILIIVDVLLLLMSFFYTDSFHKVIRNSGFIISTILLRLSFSASGLVNNVLIFSSLLFGLFILLIHNQFEKLKSKD